MAPAMFDRVKFGFERDDYDMSHTKEVFAAYSQANALLDMAAAVAAASEGG